MQADFITPVPWDSETFGVDCYEIVSVSEQALRQAEKQPGHYTLKIDPLADKALLHRFGFYYVDTLLTPVCRENDLHFYEHPDCHVAPADSLDTLLNMCDGSFVYGRFHRDFNLADAAADQRYRKWLQQLYVHEGDVFTLIYRGEAAGFIAHKDCVLVLHAMHASVRGHGLARYFWSAVCRQLFQQGADELRSSISAANLAALNLYASLGFRVRGAVDVYHRLTR